MKKLLLVFCFIVLLSGSATAQPVDLANISLPPDIIVTLERADANSACYFFRSKDGAVWRTMSMDLEKNIPVAPGEQGKKKALQVFQENWEHWWEYALKPPGNPDFISVEPVKKLTLDGKDCINACHKWSNMDVVLNIEAFVVSEPDGVKAFEFTCADCDLHYWHPIMLMIAGATSSKRAIS